MRDVRCCCMARQSLCSDWLTLDIKALRSLETSATTRCDVTVEWNVEVRWVLNGSLKRVVRFLLHRVIIVIIICLWRTHYLNTDLSLITQTFGMVAMFVFADSHRIYHHNRQSVYDLPPCAGQKLKVFVRAPYCCCTPYKTVPCCRKVYCSTPYHYSKVSGAGVASSWLVRAFTMLLLIVENVKLRRWGFLWWRSIFAECVYWSQEVKCGHSVG